MQELLDRPGNFSFLETDEEWIYQLEKDYRLINKIPGAWDFLRNCCDDNYMFNANRRDPLFKKINNTICNSSEHTGASFGCIMNNMQIISKFGWIEYKKDLKIKSF
jgi:hypothetical protein